MPRPPSPVPPRAADAPRRGACSPAIGLVKTTLASVAVATGVAAFTPFAPFSAAAAPLTAERITPGNVATHRVGGPDAVGGLGDWFLSNGTICAVVSDADHESALSPVGGVLVDLGHCGAENDQWVALQPMVNLSQNALIDVESIAAGVEPARAWIETRARFEGVVLKTTYAVDPAHPQVLDVELEARREVPGESIFAVSFLVFHPSAQTPFFALSRRDPEASPGFVFPSADRSSLTAMLGSIAASDLTVIVGSDGLPPVAYGVEHVAADSVTADASEGLGSFAVNEDHYTLMSSLVDPPWLGEPEASPGLLRLAQIAFADLEPDEVVRLRHRVHVADRADVSAITDRVFNYAAPVRGRVEAEDARVHVERASGTPVTAFRPEADGRFSLRLPTGRYRARVVARGGRTTTVEFDVDRYDAPIELPTIALDPPARVSLPAGFVGRLVFLPEAGGEALRFGSNLLGQRVGADAVPGPTETRWLSLSASAADPSSVVVPPGRYRVLAARGPEYASAEQVIEARAGETVALALAPLERVAPTPGWIAADLHVHTGTSFDSGLPPERQFAAFAASGAEVLVATEHDRVFDPGPALRATGLDRHLVSMTGVEATSVFEGRDSPHSIGHLNAFPMVPDPTAYRGGAPSLEGRRLRDVLADLRQQAGDPFVQLNHPRAHAPGLASDAYLTHLGHVGEPFDPTRPLAEAPNATLIEPSPEHGGSDLDVHGIELRNGIGEDYYRWVRADWLSLMLQGERLVATANSDSHRLGVAVGLPRTYVAQSDDGLAAYDEAAFLAALRAGRAWGTTGPLLDVRLGEAGLGGLHTGQTGTLEIAVDAAPWVPVAEWRAYVNGELVHRAPVARGGRARLPLAFAADAFVTVEVEGPVEGRYATMYPGFVPHAFTNPIFVDADANGRFDAPGLPETLPATIRDPLGAD